MPQCTSGVGALVLTLTLGVNSAHNRILLGLLLRRNSVLGTNSGNSVIVSYKTKFKVGLLFHEKLVPAGTNSSVHGPNILSQAPGSLVSENFGRRAFIFKDCANFPDFQ